jgi:hypothetical protein
MKFMMLTSEVHNASGFALSGCQLCMAVPVVNMCRGLLTQGDITDECLAYLHAYPTSHYLQNVELWTRQDRRNQLRARRTGGMEVASIAGCQSLHFSSAAATTRR